MTDSAKEWLHQFVGISADLYSQRESVNADLEAASKETKTLSDVTAEIALSVEEAKKQLQNASQSTVTSLHDATSKGSASILTAAAEVERLSEKLKRLKEARELITLAESIYFKAADDCYVNMPEELRKLQCQRILKPGGSNKVCDIARLLLKALEADLKVRCVSKIKSALSSHGYPFSDDPKSKTEMKDVDNFTAACNILVMLDAQKLLMCFCEPFDVRFTYHFKGQLKTNNVEKPEWYLNQTLSWIKIHLPFWVKTLRPVSEWAKECDLKSSALHSDVISNILQLPMTKLESDIVDIAHDVVLFSHLVDEVIIFQQDLHLLNLAHASNLLEFLATSDKYVKLWLSIEHSCVSEEIEGLLATDRAWACDPDDKRKVPEFCERYLLLINGMVKRYCLIRDEGARLKFFSMQHKLIDDLRVRLLQLTSGFKSVWKEKYMATMNVAHFIVHQLKEWNSASFYIRLQDLRRQNPSGPAGKQLVVKDDTALTNLVTTDEVFGNFVDLYSRMISDMWDTVVNDVLLPELRLTLKAYSELKWHSQEAFAKDGAWSMTPEYNPFLLRLQERLSFIRDNVSRALLAQFLQLFCARLAFQYKNFTMQLSFALPGAEQFVADFKNGVLPLLTVLSKLAKMPVPPSTYFGELFDIFKVLTSHSTKLVAAADSLGSLDVLETLGCRMLKMEVLKGVIKLRVDC